MSDTLRIGIIGCGRPYKTEGATGFGMSNIHMQGYALIPGAKLVALADVKPENARLFQEKHGGERIYTDYREMLAKEKLDVVSIGTWPHLHAEMAIAAANAGVRAVHCEKPMALTYGDAKRMVEAAEANHCQLTFDHQRRFNPNLRKARELLRDGAIGKLLRVEATCANLYDWGTHWFDIMNFFNDESPAEWVIGQIDTRGTHDVFAAPCEGQGLSHIKFANGVRGLMITGYQADLGGPQIRLLGAEGRIDVVNGDGRDFLIRRKDAAATEKVEAPADDVWKGAVAQGVIDLVDALRTGREPELSARRALRATELIFATYESSRRRGRVDLPLQIDDSPLMDMLGRKP